MKGTLSISHNGTIIQQRSFDSDYTKNRIIEEWKLQYGKGFKNAEIAEEIVPLKPMGRPKKVKGFAPKTFHFKKRDTKSSDSRL